MKKYLIQITEEYFTATLSDEDFNVVKENINGEHFSEYNIKLDNGEIIDCGIIDDIKEYKLETKEIILPITKEEYRIAKGCMDFYLDNWEEIESKKDNKYRLSDGTVFNSQEDFEGFFYLIPKLKKEYIIDDDVVFRLEVDNCIEMGHHGYINNSLYTKDGELLIHNTSKYSIEDLEKGFTFSIIENIHNENTIFEITDLGESLLSNTIYKVKFNLV